jgi:GLPGLI family protein
MSKLIVTLTMMVVLISMEVSAQDFQGKAVYESKFLFNTDKIVSDKISENEDLKIALKAAMKKSSEKTFTLVFNKQEAVYEENEELQQPTALSNGFSMSVRMSGGGKKYINTKEKISLEEDEIFGKEFLIEEPLVQPKWTLVNETKKIGDYTCMKAELNIPVTEKQKETYKEFLKKEENKPALFKLEEPKDRVVTAWYTPEIPVSFGPNNYWGLPGLILELNEDRTIILCSKVVLNSKDKVKIKRPKVGDKVSQKEFDTIQEKKSNSMKDGDGVIIRSYSE